MAGLVPAIHVLQVCPSMQSKPDPAGNPEWNDMYDCITWQSTWMAGTSPAMTECRMTVAQLTS